MRFLFWTSFRPLVVEAPTFFVGRAWAQQHFGASEVRHETYRDRGPYQLRPGRDVRLRYEGSDYAGTMRLRVSERLENAWTPWRDVVGDLTMHGVADEDVRRAVERHERRRHA